MTGFSPGVYRSFEGTPVIQKGMGMSVVYSVNILAVINLTPRELICRKGHEICTLFGRRGPTVYWDIG